MDGMAFVFTSLDDISVKFKLFYDLLSYEMVELFKYRAYFQEAEGRIIRKGIFRATLRESNSRRQITNNSLSSDIDRVMASFFRRLRGDNDPDLLINCFVVTKESQFADARLARISEDLVSRIRNINTSSGEQLTDLIERVKKTQRNEFVIVVGTKGAGKSTFIDRFFSYVLPKYLLQDCIIARVDLGKSEGNENNIASWLDNRLLKRLEDALFGDEGPSFEDIKSMFFDEYKRRKNGTLRPLYETNKEAFNIDFGQHVENKRENQTHEYIKRLIKHIVQMRDKIPCIVFDNADHFAIEFQERVFQYARSIYESEICLIIMPITDRTSWQLSKEGALRSFENESLFLPTPNTRTVLMKRLEFLEVKLAEERKETGRGYFISRGINLSIENLNAFTATLQHIFLNTGEVSSWIGNLANNDIRQCLEIARHIVTSPHLEVHELINAYILNSNITIPTYKIKRAIIRDKYDIHPGDINRFVRNIYVSKTETDTSPLFGIRILTLLKDVYNSNDEDKFLEIEHVIEYFRAMLIEPGVTLDWINYMLETGLCFNYDPTITTIERASKIEISPSGFQHLQWGIYD